MQSIKQRDRQQGKRNPLHFYSCQRTWQEVQQGVQLGEQGVQEEVVQVVQEELEEVVQEEEVEEDDDRRQTKAL